MSRVFLDTNIFIYLIENEGPLGQSAFELVERLSARRDEVLTSALTLGEVLTQPIAKGDRQLAAEYEKKLTSPGIQVIDFGRSAARIFAEIRQDRSIKAPDAIQLSVAAASRCDLFVTNDDRLSRKLVPGITFITSLSRVPL